MIELNKLLQAQFNKMCATGKLFRSKISGQTVWDTYITSFTTENNPIFRDPESTMHNCKLCNNFIRRYGNIVAIDENLNLMSIWDIEAPEEYARSCIAMSLQLEISPIEDVFFETFSELNSLPYESISKIQSVYQLGIHKNVKRYTKEEAEKFGVVKPNEIRTFNHFHLFLPAFFVNKENKSIETLMGNYRDNKNVFQRSMEISLDTLYLVRDLINQDSLLDGKTHLYKVENLIQFKTEYDSIPIDKRENWCWVTSYNNPFAKFRNELIGTLCIELNEEGANINKACETWNKRVDPVNYMKATSPITKKQIEEARKFVEENNYTESFNRRFATLDDIKSSEILHLNIGKPEVKNVSIFDNVKANSTKYKHNEFNNIEEVPIEKFMTDILPNCTSVEVLLLSKYENNLVSLTTANIPDSKPIFKWSNNYSWTFNGNLAGKSQIKEAIKDAGGNINGVLMSRLVWNDANQNDHSDLDLWCSQPNGIHIGFSTGYRKDQNNHFTSLSGQLDLDDQGQSAKLHMENIYFLDKSKMIPGTYGFWVNQYHANNSKGFKAEIEFEEELYTYEVKGEIRGNVKLANIKLDKQGNFTIEHILTPIESEYVNKEIYGLVTNQFHKVNLICLSPNYWDQNHVGNKHYFFMLEDCKCPTPIRSFHNENLISELLQYRKVIEVLGETNMIKPADKQLSGLGFNITVRDELILRLQGSFKRVIKIKF